jgi:hypothetical protein
VNLITFSAVGERKEKGKETRWLRLLQQQQLNVARVARGCARQMSFETFFPFFYY